MWHALLKNWPNMTMARHLHKENTAAYRGPPPCTQSQLIPTEIRVQQCTKLQSNQMVVVNLALMRNYKTVSGREVKPLVWATMPMLGEGLEVIIRPMATLSR